MIAVFQFPRRLPSPQYKNIDRKRSKKEVGKLINDLFVKQDVIFVVVSLQYVGKTWILFPLA